MFTMKKIALSMFFLISILLSFLFLNNLLHKKYESASDNKYYMIDTRTGEVIEVGEAEDFYLNEDEVEDKR